MKPQHIFKLATLFLLFVAPHFAAADTIPGFAWAAGNTGVSASSNPGPKPCSEVPYNTGGYYLSHVEESVVGPICYQWSGPNTHNTQHVFFGCRYETHPYLIDYGGSQGSYYATCSDTPPDCPEDQPHLEYGCDGGLITGLEGGVPVCSHSIPDTLCRDECIYDRPQHVIGGSNQYPGSDFVTNSRWLYSSNGTSCGEDTELDGDPIQEDTDSDGVPDAQDNCPDVSNPDQLDTDSDGQGDACQQGTGDGDGSGDESDGEGDGSGEDGSDEGDGTGQGTDQGDGTTDNGDGTGDDETDGGSTGGGDGEDPGTGDVASLGSCNPESGDICGDSIWEPRYPDGLLGVWNSHQAAIDQSVLVTWLRSWSLPDSGTCPQVSMSFNLGALGSFGGGSLPGTDFCWIWNVLAAIINFCALLLARALIFGG